AVESGPGPAGVSVRPVDDHGSSGRAETLPARSGTTGGDAEHASGQALHPGEEDHRRHQEGQETKEELKHKHRPHSSLVDPHLPKLRMSPAAMFEHGMARAGYIEVPRDPDLAYEFLRTRWRTVQHYGVEIDGRRYTDPDGVLKQFENQTSPYTGKAKGRWPFQDDPDDITRVYFRDPHEHRWHTLRWEHAPTLDMPLSEDALVFARRLATAKYTYPDDKVAVADLLERWNLGLGTTLAERRMALRLSREQAAIDLPAPSPEQTVSSLPSVARVLAATSEPASTPTREVSEEPDERATQMGDDDTDDLEDLDADRDFYADAFKDV
ncbi:hypothetical protein ACIG5F_47770, partial [Kutzneria sp. NPDC052558]